MDPTIHHGTLPIILSGPKPVKAPRGILDTCSFELLTTAAMWEQDAADLGFTYEESIPDYPAMFVQSLQQEEESNLTATVSVSCIGLLGNDEKRKRRLSAAGQEVAVGPFEKVVLVWNDDESGEEVGGVPLDKVKRRVPKLESSGLKEGEVVYKKISTPSGLGERWNVRQAILVVTDTYFTTTEPASSAIGTALAPPNAPTPPSYIWGGYLEAMRFNHPNGWVLDDRQSDEIIPGKLWEVTDTSGYYYSAIPD